MFSPVARGCRLAVFSSNTCKFSRSRFVSSFSSRRQELNAAATSSANDPSGLSIPNTVVDNLKAKSESLTQGHLTFGSSTPTHSWRVGEENQARDPLQSVLDHEAASIVLRDACKCAKCVDPSTQQRDFNVADIPIDVEPSSFSRDRHGNLTIKWRNDIPGWGEHASTFTPSQLRRLYDQVQPEHRSSTRLWDRHTYQTNKIDIDYNDYMNSDQALAKTLHGLAKFGLVYIKNVPEDEKSVTTIAERIGHVRQTFYGPSWNVRSIPHAKNVAYTSKYLGFHCDLLYLKETPGVQLLHCLQNSCTGGESRFVDQMKALDVLFSESPDLANTLTNIKLRYGYENDGFYYTDIKPIVQKGPESHVFPRRRVRGASHRALHDVYRIYWSPPFVVSILEDFTRSRSDIEQNLKAMKMYADILEREELVYQEKMEPGTCVMFDNVRVLHARNEFDVNSGKRWLRGTYVDAQDVCNKEISLSEHVSYLDMQEFPGHE